MAVSILAMKTDVVKEALMWPRQNRREEKRRSKDCEQDGGAPHNQSQTISHTWLITYLRNPDKCPLANATRNAPDFNTR